MFVPTCCLAKFQDSEDTWTQLARPVRFLSRLIKIAHLCENAFRSVEVTLSERNSVVLLQHSMVLRGLDNLQIEKRLFRLQHNCSPVDEDG